MNNLSAREEKRYQLILQIRSFLQEGCSHREIARRLGISTKTIWKFKEGDPKKLCQSGINQSKLDVYREDIYKCLADGYSKSRTVKYLFSLGYNGVKSTAFDYLVKIENITGRYFAPQPYVRTHTEAMKYKSGSKGKKADYLTRAGIFRYLWMDESLLATEHIEYLLKHYQVLWEIRRCIREFRFIFNRFHMPRLYLFLEHYSNSQIPEIKSFAKGLIRDLDAVENAVASNLSNGFVEGTNSKLKMIKRTMYGRCSRELLSAKMMLKNNR